MQRGAAPFRSTVRPPRGEGGERPSGRSGFGLAVRMTAIQANPREFATAHVIFKVKLGVIRNVSIRTFTIKAV